MEHYVRHVTLDNGLVITVRPWGALRETPRRAEWMNWVGLALRATVGHETITDQQAEHLSTLTLRLLRASLDEPEDASHVRTPTDEVQCMFAMLEVNQIEAYVGKVTGMAARAMQSASPASPSDLNHWTPTGGAK